MSYQVLARKYRPQRFSDVIGQDHVTRTLKNAITQQRIAHGYIFSGHRGIGKTTIARILAMALNCRQSDQPVPEPCGECESCREVRAGNAVDVIEIDAATNRGIDEIRELREAARYRPSRDRYKIYILDEAHQITDAAFNALLKTLEEPPPHIIFMMATTQPEDIPQTIRSRCQHFSFHAVRFDDIVGQIKDIATQEKLAIDDDAVAVLAEAGDGSMRDALSILDQAIAGSGAATITAEQARGLVGTISSQVLESLMNSVARDSSQEALQLIDRLVTEGQSPMHFARQFVRFLRNALVAKVSGSDSRLLQVSADERARVGRIAEMFSEEDLARFLQITLRTHDELGYKQEQRFHLELGVLKMVHAQRLLPIEELLSQQPLPVSAPRPSAPPPGTSTRAASTAPAAPFGRSTGFTTHVSSPERAVTERSVPECAASPAAPSPFETDRARKSGGSEPEISAQHTSPAQASASQNAVAVAEPGVASDVNSIQVASAAPASNFNAIESVRAAVVNALESAGHGAPATLLDEGEWSLAGNEATVQVAASNVMIEMSFGAEPRKVMNAAASNAAGAPLKIKVVSGGPANGAPKTASRSETRSAGSARSRAADDPIVQHMQEKFGAEIRTVIDHKNKN